MKVSLSLVLASAVGAYAAPAAVTKDLAAMADARGFVPSVCVSNECKHFKGIVANKKGTVVHKSLITSHRALRAYFNGPPGTRLTVLREVDSTELDTIGATPLTQEYEEVLEIIECFKPGKYVWFVYGTTENVQGPFHMWLARDQRVNECGTVKVTNEGKSDIAPMAVLGAARPPQAKVDPLPAAPASPPPVIPPSAPLTSSIPLEEPDGSAVPVGSVDVEKIQEHLQANPITHPDDKEPIAEAPATYGTPQAYFPPQVNTHAQPVYINGQGYYPVVYQQPQPQPPMYFQPQPQAPVYYPPMQQQQPMGSFYYPQQQQQQDLSAVPSRNPPANSNKAQKQDSIPIGSVDMEKALAANQNVNAIPIGVVDLSKALAAAAAAVMPNENTGSAPVAKQPVHAVVVDNNNIPIGVVDLSKLQVVGGDTVQAPVVEVDEDGSVVDMMDGDEVEEEKNVTADPLEVVLDDDITDEDIDQVLGGTVEVVKPGKAPAAAAPTSASIPVATIVAPKAPSPAAVAPAPQKEVSASSPESFIHTTTTTTTNGKDIHITATVVAEDERFEKLKIAVIVIGSLALALCLAASVGCCCFLKRRRQKINQVEAAHTLPKATKPKKGSKKLSTDNLAIPNGAPAWCLTPQLRKKAEAEGCTGLSHQAGLDVLSGSEEAPMSTYAYPPAMLNRQSDCPPAYPLSPDSTSSEADEFAFKESANRAATRKMSKPANKKPTSEVAAAWASIDLDTSTDDQSAKLLNHDQLQRTTTDPKRSRLQMI